MKTLPLIIGLLLITIGLSPETLSYSNSIFVPIIHEETETTATVTATMYNPVPSQTDATPYLTACLFKIKKHRICQQKFVALSRDLLVRWGGHFKYGEVVLIEEAGKKDGLYIVADTMNKRYKHRIDFLEGVGMKHYKYLNVKITKV